MSHKGDRDLSKKKKPTSGKKIGPAGPPVIPTSDSQVAQANCEGKLSVIIVEMARSLLKKPDTDPSETGERAMLQLAAMTWNLPENNSILLENDRKMLETLDWGRVKPWGEFVSENIDILVEKLVAYRLKHFPGDHRRIMSVEVKPDGNFRVHWVYPDEPVASPPVAVPLQSRAAEVQVGRPIADCLVATMKRKTSRKVVNLKEYLLGRKAAEELQQTMVSREALAAYHPAHAAYIYAQNQVSGMSEQLTALKEMEPFAKLVSGTEERYMPGGPPLSSLTTSYFTCWAFFDACLGDSLETIGTTILAVGGAFGMDPELLRGIMLMQQSRMGIYVNEGALGNLVILRELVTDRVCRAIVPAGYRGKKGELWYVRVLPPPIPGGSEHVVFTTPYVFVMSGLKEWQAYFRRTLPDTPLQARIEAYEFHMKYGPTRDYWNEFLFESYVNYRREVIFLEGLPDVPESRPHSGVYRS
jgi:hypothetical protein